MFGDDPLQDGRIALPIPRTFRIDDCNWPALADAKAVRLGAQDPALFRKLKLFEAPLEEVPRDEAAIFVAALGRGLIAAEEDVSPRSGNADAGGDLSLGFCQSLSFPIPQSPNARSL